jgi:hypothetical protein
MNQVAGARRTVRLAGQPSMKEGRMQSEPTTFMGWQAEVKPILMSMMGALYLAQDATSRGPQALLSASDQLLAASNHAACWIPTHRCPVSDLDGMLTKMTRSYADASQLLEAEAKNPSGPDRHTLDRQLNSLIGMLAVMWSVMRELTAATADRELAHRPEGLG